QSSFLILLSSTETAGYFFLQWSFPAGGQTHLLQLARTPTHTHTHKRHTATHTCILGGDTGHTHTHTQAEVAVNFSSSFFPSRAVLPPGPQEQWAAFRRPGTR